MATKQQIDIMIDPKTGEMSADVIKGPGGSLCEQMLADLLKIKPVSTDKKKEYYQKRQVVKKTKIRS